MLRLRFQRTLGAGSRLLCWKLKAFQVSECPGSNALQIMVFKTIHGIQYALYTPVTARKKAQEEMWTLPILNMNQIHCWVSHQVPWEWMLQ
ncbi:hypothetical protein AV530_016065 [Patagioenas fasciata monilis]|uniref:Uncharacterized protein n=1 Tax=Patagioenas fasciata monilis TaxID=372326 RepID=A0A1V4KJW3_PATFA|nr:hypothetical protein AV530_016065 [Patagioenas fasciata monilis]